MENKISATELARNLGDVLGKVRYRREVFIVERNGEAIARLAPLASGAAANLADGLRAWRAAAVCDPAFADDLERVNAADRPPRNPWE
jgi:antitoxin (DNA-binding transcriptional repressor) of toxin-antitoxin stability system